MSIIPTGSARLFLTNVSGERQEIGVIASGNISVGGGPFFPFASGEESEEITLISGPLFGTGLIRSGGSPIPQLQSGELQSGAMGSGQINFMGLGSGLVGSFFIASGQFSNIIPRSLPVRICACCKREMTISAQGQAHVTVNEYSTLSNYCGECTGYTKEKGIITRKDLLIARTGLLPETPIGIVLDFMIDHDFPESDIAYLRRFIK